MAMLVLVAHQQDPGTCAGVSIAPLHTVIVTTGIYIASAGGCRLLLWGWALCNRQHFCDASEDCERVGRGSYWRSCFWRCRCCSHAKEIVQINASDSWGVCSCTGT
jgi:hypothetical protein